METPENTVEEITTGQRLTYFVVIPLLFTIALLGVGSIILQQGKGKSFSDSLMSVGITTAAATKGISSLINSKQVAPASTDQAAGVPEPAANSAPNPVTNPLASPAGSPSPAAPSSGTSSGGTVSSSTTSSTRPDEAAVKFKQRTDEVAAEFTKMNPAQASQIIGKMSAKDAIFTMLGMKTQQRSDILAKMDPKQAADLANLLADFPPSKSNDPAVEQQLQHLPNSQTQLDDLVKTYSQVPASSAALLITELMKADSGQAVNVIAKMDNATRAQILTAMSNTKTNPDGLKYATMITERLLSLK